MTKLTVSKPWIPCAERLPPEGVAVNTKIDDGQGVRNVQPLCRGGGGGRLWFVPDGSMYVYYEPTHWQPMAEAAS